MLLDRPTSGTFETALELLRSAVGTHQSRPGYRLVSLEVPIHEFSSDQRT